MSLDDAGKPTANAAVRSKPPKLPLWRTVGQAYILWARNFPELLRTCWLWLLLLAPFIAIDAWLRAPQTAALLRALRSDDPSFDLTPSITALLLSLLTLPAAASIAVAWHRLVLRNEHPGSGIYLRLDSVVVGYTLIFAVIWLPVRSVSLVIRLIGDGMAPWLVVSVLSFAFLFIMPRLSLALPARALERRDVTLYAAWQATRRNTWRLFWAYVVCIVPASGIAHLAFQALPPEPTVTTLAIFEFVWKLLAIPLGLIPIGMLSLAYRHFFERGE